MGESLRKPRATPRISLRTFHSRPPPTKNGSASPALLFLHTSSQPRSLLRSCCLTPPALQFDLLSWRPLGPMQVRAPRDHLTLLDAHGGAGLVPTGCPSTFALPNGKEKARPRRAGPCEDPCSCVSSPSRACAGAPARSSLGRVPAHPLAAHGLRPISVLRFWISEGDSSTILNLEGWNAHLHREFQAKLESTNLSRDNLSREIGRTPPSAALRSRAHPSCLRAAVLGWRAGGLAGWRCPSSCHPSPSPPPLVRSCRKPRTRSCRDLGFMLGFDSGLELTHEG